MFPLAPVSTFRRIRCCPVFCGQTISVLTNTSSRFPDCIPRIRIVSNCSKFYSCSSDVLHSGCSPISCTTFWKLCFLKRSCRFCGCPFLRLFDLPWEGWRSLYGVRPRSPLRDDLHTLAQWPFLPQALHMSLYAGHCLG